MIYLATTPNDKKEHVYINLLLSGDKLSLFVDHKKDDYDENKTQFSMNIKSFTDIKRILESLSKSIDTLIFDVHIEEKNITKQLDSFNEENNPKQDEDLVLIKSFGIINNDQITNQQ